MLAAKPSRTARHFAPISKRTGEFPAAVVVEHHMSGDDVDVSLDPLQGVVQELRAGTGGLEQIGDHRTGFVHDVRRGHPHPGSHLAADVLPVADPSWMSAAAESARARMARSRARASPSRTCAAG